MNLTLWIVAGLLATVFATGGVAKLVISKEKLATAPGGGWIDDFSPGAVKALGIVDLLAAAGLVLPAALGIAPVLVPLAAVGVVSLMIGAVIVRLRHGAPQAIVVDLTYLALAAFVAWGRVGLSPSRPDASRPLHSGGASGIVRAWWRGADLNRRPSGYESDGRGPIASNSLPEYTADQGLFEYEVSICTSLYHRIPARGVEIV